MKKWQLYLILVMIILLVGFVFGYKAAGGLALFGIGGATGIKKKVDKAKKEVEKDQKYHENMQEKADQHQENIDKLNDRLEKADQKDEKINKTFWSFFNLLSIFLMIVILLLVPVTIYAKDNNNAINLPTIEEAKEIPDNYEGLKVRYFELLDAYIDMYTQKETYKNLAHDYKSELDSVKADLDKMIENDKQDEEMKERLLEYIHELIKVQKKGFEIEAGVNYVPLNPKNLGVMLSLGYEF